MENKRFRVVGIENGLKTVPASVSIICASDDGKLYRGFSTGEANDSCYTYTGFEEVGQNADLEALNIKPLRQCHTMFSDVAETYGVGDVVALGMEPFKDMVFIGRIDRYLEFITENEHQLAANNQDSEKIKNDIDCDIAFLTPLVNAARENGDLPRQL